MGIDRCLIVDDNSANSLFFEVLFKELGYTAYTATTGDEGLKIAVQNHAQFVVTAWELSGMPGTIFIQKVRSARNRRFLPCLIYSRRMSEEDVKLTKDLGFKDILPMPFDKDGASEVIRDVIRRENNISKTEVTLRKMESYVLDGKPQEALKLLSDQILQKGEFQCRAYTVTADIWNRLGKTDKALQSAQQALEIDADYTKAKQVLARIYSRQGKHDEAIDLLKDLNKSSPLNMSTKVNLGTAYVEADRHDEAKQVFDDIMQTDDSCQEAKDGMAVMAFKEGDTDLAAQLIAETEAGDELARIFNNMGISQISSGHFDEGISTYKKAMSLLADKARLHLLSYNLGLAFKKNKNFAEAFVEFGKSYVQAPNYEKAYASLADMANQLKSSGSKPDKDTVKQVKAARKAFKEGQSKKSA